MPQSTLETPNLSDTSQQSAPALGEAALGLIEQPEGYVHVSGDFSESPMTSEDALSNITERWSKQREEILALPSTEEGLNLQRVDNFCKRNGIEQKQVCILSPDDFEKALGIAETLLGNEDGMYLPRLGIVIVRRDQDKEALNGAGYTESVIVHEQAHATTKAVSIEVQARPTPAIVRSRIPMALIPNDERSGFTVSTPTGKKRGSYLEEGLPELARGKYVAEELGRPKGFVGTTQIDGQSVIESKYLYFVKTPSGEVAVDHYEGAISAMTLELLIKHDPSLEAALWDARNSVKGLREIARRLDNAHPGLYVQLLNINVESKAGQIQATELFKTLSGKQAYDTSNVASNRAA